MIYVYTSRYVCINFNRHSFKFNRNYALTNINNTYTKITTTKNKPEKNYFKKLILNKITKTEIIITKYKK